MAANGELPWPSVGNFVSTYGEDLTAADTALSDIPAHDVPPSIGPDHRARRNTRRNASCAATSAMNPWQFRATRRLPIPPVNDANPGWNGGTTVVDELHLQFAANRCQLKTLDALSRPSGSEWPGVRSTGALFEAGGTCCAWTVWRFLSEDSTAWACPHYRSKPSQRR